MAWYRYEYPRTLTVGERRAKAARAAKRLGSENALDPVVIEGPLAVTWWGKAWNRNLEGYSDYSNRLPRGRSYARHGSVLDLRLEPGQVSAQVQGSGYDPYDVKITIAPMAPKARQALVAACAGRLASTESLLAGRFPEDMGSLLTAEKTGLFPHPRGLRFSCSCPDWAEMCKHVAAALYGVGSRLDRDPSLFFRLRGVRMEDLVSEAVKGETEKLLKAGGKGESQRLDLGDGALGALFGVELAKAGDASIPEPPTVQTRLPVTDGPRAPGRRKEIRRRDPQVSEVGKKPDKQARRVGSVAVKPPSKATRKALDKALEVFLKEVEELQRGLKGLGR